MMGTMDMEKGLKYVESNIAKCIEFCNSNLAEAGYPKLNIKFDVAPSNSIGGISIYDGKKYLVEVNYGVFNKIFKIYSTLLHRNNENFYQKVSLEKTFDDKKANGYWTFLTEVSLKFVIFHELGHILNGHLKYMYDKKMGNVNLNLVNEEIDELEPLFSQTLEMNADAFAATQCLAMMTFPETIDNFNERYPEIIKGKIHAFYIFYIASGILFSELGMSTPRESKPLDELYYLPLRTRFDTMIRCSTSAYLKLNPEEPIDSEILNHELLRAMASNTELYHSMLRIAEGNSELNFDVKNNLEEISQEYISHADKLFKYWSDVVREPLSKFAIFNLPK